jgi:hypothetical protein
VAGISASVRHHRRDPVRLRTIGPVTSNPSDPTGPRPPAADDTAAFQRFYFEEEPASTGRSWWYRVLVGWWRHQA